MGAGGGIEPQGFYADYLVILTYSVTYLQLLHETHCTCN